MALDRSQLKKLEQQYAVAYDAYKKALAALKSLKGDEKTRAEKELDKLDDAVAKLRTQVTEEQRRLGALLDAEVEKVLKQKPALVKEAASLKGGLDKVLKAIPGKEKELKKAKKKAELDKLDGELSQLRTSETNMRAALKKAEDAIKALDVEAKRIRDSA